MWKASTLSLAICVFSFAFSIPSHAKGLGELSEKNPETASEEVPGSESEPKAVDSATETSKISDGNQEGAPAAAPSGASKRIKGLLSLFTSVGWVRATQSGGAWSSNGFADAGIAYQLMNVTESVKLSGTYRYSPVAVTGTVNSLSYRGVWETHSIGGLLKSSLRRKWEVIAGGELGYLRSHLYSADGLTAETGAAKNGMVVTIGGGSNYLVTEGGEFTIGPRVNFVFGVSKQVQVAISGGFTF